MTSRRGAGRGAPASARSAGCFALGMRAGDDDAVVCGRGELSFRMLNGTMTCVFTRPGTAWCAGHKGKRNLYPFPFIILRVCLFLYDSFGLLCFVFEDRGLCSVVGFRGELEVWEVLYGNETLRTSGVHFYPFFFASFVSFCSVVVSVRAVVSGKASWHG